MPGKYGSNFPVSVEVSYFFSKHQMPPLTAFSKSESGFWTGILPEQAFVFGL